jgi:hypothetical protein
MSKSVHIASLLIAAAVLGGVAMPALAVDGVILIDQNKAMAGNVTPGDTPGFPVTISLPGSYRLAGNLTVPDANTNAIVIAADHVSIDLNGFAILGPTDCSGGLNPCANAGTGSGIRTDNDRFNITIRNGTVQGMGLAGIFLTGDSHLVEYMHVRSNGSGGLAVFSSRDQAGSIVQNNTAQRNGGDGIQVTRGLVSHNVADVNGNGIRILVGSVSSNVVTRNVGTGLILLGNPFQGGNYIGNMANGNFVDVNVSGAWVNQGQNICGTVACPGAQL